MLRNFIRDRGTQLTLGTFVATFVYAVLVLVPSARATGHFVPHLGVTVTLALTVADLAVLIYFIHHIATSIQLPQVIASIATTCRAPSRWKAPTTTAARPRAPAEEVRRSGTPRPHGGAGAPIAARQRLPAVHPAQQHGQVAAEADAVHQPLLPARPLHGAGPPLASVWPAEAAARVTQVLARAHVTGPHRTLTQDVAFGIDQLVEIALRALSLRSTTPSPR